MFDSDKHDRALLGLALRSALPQAEVLDAASTVDVAHHLSDGAVDVLVADPTARFGEIVNLASDIRKRYPSCLCWLFSAEGALPPLRDCIGRGIDGRTAKNSAGFLELPTVLVDRLRWITDLKQRLNVDCAAVFSSVFPGATCLINNDGNLAMVSEEFEALVEQPRFALIGQPFAQYWADGDTRDEWHTRLMRPPRSWEIVGRFSTPRARNYVVAMGLRMLRSQPEGLILWAASLTDVSEFASAMESPNGDVAGELTHSEHLAVALSHDLQAPLNSLISHGKTLQSTLQEESPEVQSAVTEIADLSVHMQQMLDAILEYSVLDKADPQREIIALDSVLEIAIANLKSAIEDSGATIEHDSLPSLAVDQSQMVRVFQNLIANAIKFCGERIPRILISAVDTNDELQIRFEDNGIGIDAHDQSRIFRLFHRAKNSKGVLGAGVGLAISQRIIRSHGGELRVESTPGRGSCFILGFRGAAVRNLDAAVTANSASG